MRKRGRSKKGTQELLLAERGRGPLLQRDYWGVIRGCRVGPVPLIREVRAHFPAFSPPELVVFWRCDEKDVPLDLGDELFVKIVGAPLCRVRVLHVEAQSFTLGTEAGHPEAGRITFGSYRNRRGDVLFHIRSLARSSSVTNRVGFLATGEVMQTSTWTDFVDRVAAAFGEGVIGFIHAVTSRADDEPADYAARAPTFAARGG